MNEFQNPAIPALWLCTFVHYSGYQQLQILMLRQKVIYLQSMYPSIRRSCKGATLYYIIVLLKSRESWMHDFLPFSKRSSCQCQPTLPPRCALRNTPQMPLLFSVRKSVEHYDPLIRLEYEGNTLAALSAVQKSVVFWCLSM